MKKLLCFLVAVLLIMISACGTVSAPPMTNAATESLEATIGTDSPIATEPTALPDQFSQEDDFVESTNDIIIDLSEFIEKQNAAHKAILDTPFTKEFIQTNAPDFHDTLGLVSKDEATALLTSRERELCTKDDALQDIDLLFRVFKSFYGSYYFFGGDEAFDAAEEQIIAEITEGPNKIASYELSAIISRNLYFIKDRHMNIGPDLLCETNKIAWHDYYVKNLYFYEDDVGYYTKIQGRKWYLDAVGTDKEICDYLKVTINENGQLCYMLCLATTVNDPRLVTTEITLARGERKAVMPILWTEFNWRPNDSLTETVSVRDGIPLIESEAAALRNYQPEEYDIQQQRLREMGEDILSQDVMVLNLNSGCGWQSLFESIDHQICSIELYKLSNIADYLGRWNMPWKEAAIGQYAVRNFQGRWGNNDTLVFAVQDRCNYSAAETTIADIHSIENIILVGGITGGTAGPGGGTNQAMVLPNTGLFVHFGASLMITSGYTEDGHCFEPDIWVNPTDAVDAIYRLCNYYGISNTADLSVLDQYQ